MNKDEKQEKTKEIEKIEDIVDDKEKEEPVIISTEEEKESEEIEKIKNEEDKEQFIDKERKIKNIIKKLKKRKLPKMQKASLVIIGVNPCLVFSIAIKFRGLLESFL